MEPVEQITHHTILLVEDDPTLARMYSTKYQKEGFKVIHAKDGEEALELAIKNRIDAIQLDMMLPKVSGSLFLQNLRQHPSGIHVPVIILSNLADHDQAERARTLGVKEYLAKAMHTPEEVVEVVKKYLPPIQAAASENI
jgi:DNA-binding response OmpR family regulator